MIINRAWAMPNKNTFNIKPINSLILKYIEYIGDKGIIIDPFANNSCLSYMCTYTNDIDHNCSTTHHLDALDFVKSFDDDTVDMVLFDPPYSPSQVSECYKKMDKTVNTQTTQSSFWGNMKKEIARVTKHNGIVVTCGWNSGGIGKQLGFNITEILIVAHGTMIQLS